MNENIHNEANFKGELHKGDRCKFRATLEKSQDDPHFGFGSRPSFLGMLEGVAV